MKDLIILGGAPGSGKSTVGELLREEAGFTLIEFGLLRQGHLNNAWTNKSSEEESMAFENLVFIINNYLKHGYHNILVTDLRNEKMSILREMFEERNIAAIYLTLSDDEELKKRVLGERDSGFRNIEAALEWNERLKSYEPQSNEFKIDTTNTTPQETAQKIVEITGGEGHKKSQHMLEAVISHEAAQAHSARLTAHSIGHNVIFSTAPSQ